MDAQHSEGGALFGDTFPTFEGMPADRDPPNSDR
jgi:hypothetical protein